MTTAMTEPGGTAEGVQFPRTDGDRRSTTATGQAVVAAALEPADPGAAEAARAERGWRHGYVGAFRRLTESTAVDAEVSLASATAGLADLHGRFVLVRDGDELPLAGAVASAAATALHGAAPGFRTATVAGRGETDRDVDGLSLPYRGRRLRGGDLEAQLDDWVARGVVEPSTSQAARAVLAHPEWLDLSDTTVVLLGAGAEMAPLVSLCRWGAHVVAVDLPGEERWRRILEVAGRGHGRVTVPVRGPRVPADDRLARDAGVDLLVEAPELVAWLRSLDLVPDASVLAHCLYADGADHVRVSMAADAVMTAIDALPLAFLATPTDTFAVPEDAVAESRRRWADRGLTGAASQPVRWLSRDRAFATNYPTTLTRHDGTVIGVADALVVQQGPNYALAKRLQRWRATVARAEGRLVSANVAPPTRTRSVLKNRALAAAYAGSSRFGLEVFDPATANTLMAALLVHDLRAPTALARPSTPLAHPDELLAGGAAHGGLWRSAYAPRSVLPLAVVLGMLQRG